ncbi:MAG: cytochrome c biogenesis protein CcsA [Chitinophagales bacterium]|nr:cytochrome c biogenesis protein CcsA [Chitinophagales bacterium]HNI45412.1 cytochrome c biogenesis protein CcsA [Chitinophagales bacterium]HNL08057.1 cytochrome c biogenesis protein CcsA [Chitinophagales bacterium]
MASLSPWKYICIFLLLYTVITGMLFPVPALAILNETIRCLYFHVPMWFGMIILLGTSVVYSMLYLSNFEYEYDIYAKQLAAVATWFGILGFLTGMIWANYTWGKPWSNDIKQNVTVIGMLIYFAYFVLRGAIEDEDKRAKIAAVYNIFAFFTFIPLIFIVPRLQDSLHPGNGGNPGFGGYDLDNTMRMVFYPAVIAWTMLGFWLADIKIRLQKLEEM